MFEFAPTVNPGVIDISDISSQGPTGGVIGRGGSCSGGVGSAGTTGDIGGVGSAGTTGDIGDGDIGDGDIGTLEPTDTVCLEGCAKGISFLETSEF